MKIITDAGGTSSKWAIIANDKTYKTVETTGINAMHMSVERMSQIVKDELLPAVATEADDVEEIFFYGAGVVDNTLKHNVSSALKESFRDVIIEVDTDLLGAARALCGHHAGIACILGTGSNSCYFDGEEIVANVSPLGYILGDEGSGAVLGRRLIADVLKNQLPEDVCSKFLTQYATNATEIIKRVYRQPEANKYMASFVPFLKENIDNSDINNLVIDSLRLFFKRNVAQYPGSHDMPINFTGSIAWHFAEQLKEAARQEGFMVGKIEVSPLPGMIGYHS